MNMKIQYLLIIVIEESSDYTLVVTFEIKFLKKYQFYMSQSYV